MAVRGGSWRFMAVIRRTDNNMADEQTTTDAIQQTRRETRRRRILQSPEERMKKIAGVAATDSDESCRNDQISSESVETNSVPTTDHDKCIHKITEQKMEKKVMQNITDSKKEPYIDVKEKESVEEININNDGMSKSKQEMNNKTRLSLKNSVLSGVLGVVLRLILCLEFGLWNKQSIVVQFLVSQIFLMKFNKYEDPEATSRPIPLPGLITTMLLAGVQNPALAVISRIIYTITEFLNNFATFLFFFVAAHIFIEAIA